MSICAVEGYYSKNFEGGLIENIFNIKMTTLLSLDVLGLVGGFIAPMCDIVNFQMMSINSYISVIDEARRIGSYGLRRFDQLMIYTRLPINHDDAVQNDPTMATVLKILADSVNHWTMDLLWRETFTELNKFVEFDTFYMCMDNVHHYTSIWRELSVVFANVCLSGKPTICALSYYVGFQTINRRCITNAGSVRFMNMPNVTILDESFNLFACRIDYTGIYNLRAMGDTFLYTWRCKHIVCPSMARFKTIGNRVGLLCENLLTIDLNGLTRVTSIGNDFLLDCQNLLSVKGYDFSRLVEVGDRFLYGCKRLISLDLHTMTNIEKVGENFLCALIECQTLVLPKKTKITKHRFSMLCNCASLQEIDLSFLSGVKRIQGNFLMHCFGLTKIDLTPLANVKSIGNYFMYGCTRVTSIDCTPFSNVVEIEQSFLGHTGLTRFDFAGLGAVRKIGKCCLEKCYGLQHVSFVGLRSITRISSYLLQQCFALDSVDITALANIEIHEKDKFFVECARLTDIIYSLPIKTPAIIQIESLAFISKKLSAFQKRRKRYEY